MDMWAEILKQAQKKKYTEGKSKRKKKKKKARAERSRRPVPYRDKVMSLRELLLLRGTEDMLKDVPELDYDNLLSMTKVLAENISGHLKISGDILMAMQADISQELDQLNIKEVNIGDVATKITFVLDSLKLLHSRLPNYTQPADRIDIVNIKHANHHCRICMCHDWPETVTLDTKESAMAAKRTLENCFKYTSLLTTLRQRYKALSLQLLSTQRMVAQAIKMANLSYNATLSENELIMSMSLEGVDMSDKLPQLIEALQKQMYEEKDLRAAFDFVWFLTATVVRMNNSVLVAVRTSRSQLGTLKKQNDLLESMAVQFDSADELVTTIAMDVARLRCGSDRNTVMLTEKMLHAFHCRYCKCYNAPLDHGLNSWVKQAEHVQEGLTSAFSYLSQGLDGVQMAVKQTYRGDRIVTAVDRPLWDAVHASRQAVLGALERNISLESIKQKKKKKPKQTSSTYLRVPPKDDIL
jgi:hypothetical protein